jgi:hypothetical protein
MWCIIVLGPQVDSHHANAAAVPALVCCQQLAAPTNHELLLPCACCCCVVLQDGKLSIAEAVNMLNGPEISGAIQQATGQPHTKRTEADINTW